VLRVAQMALPAQAPRACVLRDQGSLRVLEAAPPSPRQDQLGGFTLTDRPLAREQLCEALGELFDIFNESDGLIECEEDAEGFPVGDSNEANMKRLISEVTGRTSRLIVNLQLRGIEAAPPTKSDWF
jgi:hypothetical protein